MKVMFFITLLAIGYAADVHYCNGMYSRNVSSMLAQIVGHFR
jgi:hypothetical protein